MSRLSENKRILSVAAGKRPNVPGKPGLLREIKKKYGKLGQASMF